MIGKSKFLVTKEEYLKAKDLEKEWPEDISVRKIGSKGQPDKHRILIEVSFPKPYNCDRDLFMRFLPGAHLYRGS